jgi:hypothetical protein
LKASKHGQKGSGSMSSPQDLTVVKALTSAFLRCTYGKRYSKSLEAFELASEIKYARSTFPRESDPADLNRRERNQIRKRKDSMGQRLLAAAMRSAKELRLIADVLDENESQDPRQSNIIGAYLACLVTNGRLPTLTELRREFVAGFGEHCWPAPYSVRKTLEWLELPLAKAKRGRPGGSRSQIGNPT